MPLLREVDGRAVSGPPFRRARWLALAWAAVWAPLYLWQYGPGVFLNLSDVAVTLTCIGLWFGSPLLLSSQALSTLVVDLVWNLDLAWRALTGGHLVGRTEYMWDPKYPLWLRLLSLFHLWMPIVLLWAVRRTGYDPRAFGLQSGIAAVLILASRVLSAPEANLNFSYRDPILGRSWGPAVAHLLLTWGALVVVYWLTGRALQRLAPPPQPGTLSRRRHLTADTPPTMMGR